MNRVSAQIEGTAEGMQLPPGISAVGDAVPALQFIAPHQHVSQRVPLDLQRDIQRIILIVSDAEFIQAVVHQDRGQRV